MPNERTAQAAQTAPGKAYKFVAAPDLDGQIQDFRYGNRIPTSQRAMDILVRRGLAFSPDPISDSA